MPGIARSLLPAAVIALVSGGAGAESPIGIAGPMTGQYAIFGEQLRRGAEQAVEDLNTRGGVLGERLALRIGDDACDPKQGVAVANRMASAGVVFVAGHFCSGSSIAASTIYHEEGILQITPASTNPQLTEQGFDNVFRVSGRDDQQGVLAADYVMDHRIGSRIAVLHDQSTYGTGLADAFRGQLKARGVRETIYRVITAGDRDFTAPIAEMKQAGIDLIYLGGYHTEAGLLVRQAHEQGLAARLMSGDALATQEYWRIAGDSGQGTLVTFSPDPRKNAAARSVVESFRRQGYEPEGYTLYAYAAIQVWSQAVEKAGSTALDAVIAALRGNRFETVLGTTSFDRKGDAIGPNYVVYEWRNGELEELAPTRRVRIQARAFVPGRFVRSGAGACEGGVVLRGDQRMGRNGQALFTRAAQRFVLRQAFEVVARREAGGNVLEVVAKRAKVKPTLEYALDALTDGKLNWQDNDAVMNDCHLLNRRATASARRLEVVGEPLAEDAVLVHLRGGIRNPWLPEGSPRLDWDLEILVDFSRDPPRYRVRGLHDGFPAIEVYVDDALAYGFDPGAPGCELAVEGRSLASYCASQLNRSGVRIPPQTGPIALGR